MADPVVEHLLVDVDKPTGKPAGLLAYQVVEMLRRHYLPEGRPIAGVFAPEITSPCGKRRADLIWMPTTIAGGGGRNRAEIHGHEVKVTRADVMVELADPTKADPWAQYCTRWWLVVAHPALLDGLTVPEAWGVLAPPSGRRTRTMTVVKAAPKLKPTDPALALARLARWLLYRDDEQLGELRRSNAFLTRDRDRLQREVDQLRATGASRHDVRAELVARIVVAAAQRLHDEHLWSDLDETAVVAAIVDHAATAAAAHSIRTRVDGLVGEVRRMIEPFGHALRQLEHARDLAARIDADAKAGSS